jgi:hypothetical protein
MLCVHRGAILEAFGQASNKIEKALIIARTSEHVKGLISGFPKKSTSSQGNAYCEAHGKRGVLTVTK